MSDSNRYIQLDEEGYFLNAGIRYNDNAFGRELLKNLRYENRTLMSTSGDVNVVVEAFNDPLVARHVSRNHEGRLQLEFPYEERAELNLHQMFVDEWDRFHTVHRGIPVVLSRNAQNDLFELAESFDDDSVTFNDKTYPVHAWYPPNETVDRAERWTEMYKSWVDDATKPGWELDAPAAALRDVSSQLKLNKARIAVLGSGTGHDAAFFAQAGHLVTAFDFSDDAIARAKEKYGNVTGLQFRKADVFNLPEEYSKQFDIVFDHTFFCAINPTRRKEAVKAYRKLLTEGGHLLGIFFILPPKEDPAFGMTEWELREHLKGKFKSLYWTRWKKSIPSRVGRELVVYAQVENFGGR